MNFLQLEKHFSHEKRDVPHQWSQVNYHIWARIKHKQWIHRPEYFVKTGTGFKFSVTDFSYHFSRNHFQPVCLLCSLVYLWGLCNLSCPGSSSLPARLTHACLSVWTQDGSGRAATVRLRTSGARAVHLIADIVEVCATHTQSRFIKS